MWELKAKVEEALQPVIIRYNRIAAMYLEESWHTLLSPYRSLIDSVGALDTCSAAEDRDNRHGFYKARSKMLIEMVEDFNKRGVWLTPEREQAAA